jgi:hypothetical protein
MALATSPLNAPSVYLPPGVQQARVSSVPVYSESAGIEAIQAYELSGQRLDEWQKAVLVGGCGERADQRWSAFEVAIIVARQNGKDEILLARELAGLFLWREMFIGHSAHLFDTAIEHLEKLVALIENTPEFLRKVKLNRGNVAHLSHGSEGITLKSGARIRFRARTKSGSFRGFTGNCMVFNEAMDLPDSLIGSILPVLSARSMETPGPQVWYAGSAVDQQTMPNGLVLARLREAGIRGGNDRLAFFEHSASVRDWMLAHGRRFDAKRAEIDQVTTEFLADLENRAQANPALGVRISHEHVETERRSPSMTARQFAIERLGVGDWPDTSEEKDRVISREAFAACAEHDRAKRITGRPVFAVDSSPDQGWGSLAVAGKRADGLLQGAVVEHERGTDWIVHQDPNGSWAGRAIELKKVYPGCWFLIDGSGTAVSLVDALKAAHLRVRVLTAGEYGQACMQWFAAATGIQPDGTASVPRFRFPFPQPWLDEALDVARKSTFGDSWKWTRRGSEGDISPLVAVTVASWGAEHLKRARAIDPNEILARRDRDARKAADDAAGDRAGE